jgi:hypothetical protein
MPEIDPVILRLKVEHEQYLRDLARAERVTDERLKRIDRAGFATGVALKKGFNLAQAAAVSFAGALTVDAVVGAIKTGLEYASSLGEVSQQLGVTTGDLQLFRFAASQVGIEQGEMDLGLQRLNRTLGEAADGSDKAVALFAKLQTSFRDTEGNVRSAADVLPELADGFVALGSAQQQTATAQDLFGKSGYKMLTLLQGGSKGINELANAYRRLGLELTPEQIKNADDAADKLSAVKQVLEARIAGVVADNAQEIIHLANALANLADKAIKAAGAFLKFKRDASLRDQQISRAEAYLDGRKDLTPAVRAATKARAREMIDERTGFRPLGGVGGWLGLKQKVSPSNTPRSRLVEGSNLTDFDRALGSAPGKSAGIAAMLGVDPVPVVVAVTALASGLSTLEADIAAARAELSGDLREQAEARKQQIEATLGETLARIKDEEGVSKAVKDQHSLLESQKAELDKQLVEKQLQADLDREIREAQERQLDAQEDQARIEVDALQAEADITDNQKQRLIIERRILDLRHQAERDELEAQLARNQYLDAEKARADLARKQSADGAALERDYENPLQRYARSAKNSEERVQEAAAQRIRDLNDSISRTMAKELGIKDRFVADLISIFLDKAIFGPLAERLNGGGSGGGLLGAIGGFLGGIFNPGGGIGGGLPRRAFGGPVVGHQPVLVGERGPEVFLPPSFGNIIPNHALGGGGGAVGTVRLIIEDGPHFGAKVHAIAEGVTVEYVASAAKPLREGAVNETLRRLGRPRM